MGPVVKKSLSEFYGQPSKHSDQHRTARISGFRRVPIQPRGLRNEEGEEEFETPKNEETPITVKRGPGRPSTGQRGRLKKTYNLVPTRLDYAQLAYDDPAGPSLEVGMSGPNSQEWQGAMKK